MKLRKLTHLCCVFVLFGAHDVRSQTTNLTTPTPPPTATTPSDPPKPTPPPITDPKAVLSGLGFGVGVGAVFDAGGAPRVKTASVDSSGIIRVQSEDSVRVGAVLETHYLWGLDNHVAGTNRVFFSGPQVTALMGENIIDGIGVGYMIALRRKNLESSAFSLKSFNLGTGVMIEPNAQKLGDGLKGNEHLPTGDQIRFKNKAQMGIYVMFSAGF